MSITQASDERAARVREVMTIARHNLAHHIPRRRRVAGVLEAARRTLARTDPKKQEKRNAVKAARDTIKRLAHIQAPTSNQIVRYKASENVRVTPIWPSTAPQSPSEPPLHANE